MPAVSEKQKRFMDAAAHNPEFAKKAGVPTSVAKEFSSASKGQTFSTGTRVDRQKINKPKTDHGDMALFKRGGTVATGKLFGGKETYGEEKKEAQALKSGKISPAQYVRGEKSEGHKEENVRKNARDIKSGRMSPASYAKMETSEPKGMKRGGMCKMAKGGSVRGDGCAQRGKTKGRML